MIVTILSPLLSLLVLLPSLTLAAPLDRRDTTPITSGSTINGRTYDYVIVGGGLAGMVLARRLSEDVSKSILVIEAGRDEESNADVYNAGNYQNAFGSRVDWAYQSTSQQYGGVQTLRSGKGLGGSTLINGMAWSKPHDFQIDALEQVGNTGINWASLEPYMLKAESFTPPSTNQFANGVTFRSSCHSTGGPLSIQYDPNASPGSFEKAFNTSVQSIGLPYAYDLTCGNPAGRAPIANTRNGGTRSDAYRAYVYQRSIPNLTLMTQANVGKVLLSSDSTPKATGVEFRDASGGTYTVNAGLEVLMAAGSIKTPVILQQSGIGPSSVLSSAGVSQKVNLPVGLNLIDQTTSTTNWKIGSAGGGGQPITFPRFQDLFSGTTEVNNFKSLISNASIQSYVQSAVNAGAYDSASSSGLAKILGIQADWIINKGVGMSENFDYSYGQTLGYDSWYLLPFGRGSIKINTNQPYDNNFSIDPRYLSTNADRIAQGATVRFTRKVSGTSPLSSSVQSESTPGTSTVPQNSNLDAWATWAQNHYRSNWHPIGTAAMMSQNLGGVVDSSHKVYGVSGLRVIDGSVLPFQVSSHLMSVIYGLAERAADLIKKDHPSSGSSTKTIRPQNFSGKCLTVSGTLGNGTPVQLQDCNGSSGQQWQVASAGGSGSIKTVNGDWCIDAGNPPVNDGTKLKIWQCYNGLAAQTWSTTTGGTIQLGNANECFDLTNGSGSNGNVIQTWTCYSGNTNQQWSIQ
ncbi:hypothetical protein BD324DRAFT_624787 [Kockovaella imperatae]|uniref:Glucose-methanol-choline oxidoreductase N-terminal domain-containing protein n=1 Tax=Kockovaella imperatae TaxID=4999 RepID=A0A1Y1UGF0_9TREE|nr:hypothetical protein BD324DRAFT_624787 [Kockovaella imperatae]ORX37098.1 hypothetical protein BD324DRAFT_624787 [Kockovaella imperatae]